VSGGGGWNFGGQWRGVALAAFNALSIAVADVRAVADASGLWRDFLAFLGNLRDAHDQVRRRGVAGGHAIHLRGDGIIDVRFAIRWAFLGWFRSQSSTEWTIAVLGSHAYAVGGLQESFFAEASDNAVPGANRARVRIFAGGRASSAAGAELLVHAAQWWHHHERRRRQWGFLAALNRHATTVTVAHVSLLACAAGHADARADGVQSVAGAVATLALTIFFIFAAHSRDDGHSLGGRDAALFGRYADALFVLQVAGFAEATNDALHGARDRVGLGAGRGAGGAAGHEHLVFLALRQLRRVGEEHVLPWFLHGDSWVSRCLALFWTYAFALGVLQISCRTETAADTLEGTNFGQLGIGAVRYTSGSTSEVLSIGTALRWERRDGDSEPEGANAEQQTESKAKGHR